MQNTTHEEMLPHHGQLDESGRKAHDTDICNLLNTQRRKSAKRLASNMLPNSLGLVPGSWRKRRWSGEPGTATTRLMCSRALGLSPGNQASEEEVKISPGEAGGCGFCSVRL